MCSFAVEDNLDPKINKKKVQYLQSYIPFLAQKVPVTFHFDKSYTFQISGLELCIPFNCCICKPGKFLQP